MEKIFFAINHPQVEEKIKNSLEDIDGFEFEIVFAAVHKEQIVNEILNKRPTLLILEEGLQGKVDVFTLVEKISQKLPETRIIFLAGDREVGDPKLARLVAYHVYDIVLGGKVSVKTIVDLIVEPTPYAEVTKFLNTKDDFFKDDDLLGEDNKTEKTDDTLQTSTTILIKGDTVEEVNEGSEDEKSSSKFGSFVGGFGSLISKIPKKNNNSNVEQPDYTGQDTAETPITAQDNMPLTMQNPEYPQTPTYNPGYQEPQNPMYGGHQPPQSYPYNQPPYSGGYNPSPVQNPLQPNVNNRGNSQGGFWGFGNKNKDRLVNAKQQLTVFYSPKGGIGTTISALCAAAEAANRNQKVLFIEFNQIFSAIAYWFDMPSNGFGLEDALYGVSTQNYENVTKSIISKDKLLRNCSDSSIYDNYKTLPNTLDYIFFSENFTKKSQKSNVSTNVFQDFIYFCLYQLNYDEIYLDMATSSDAALIEQSLVISGKNVILMSQDIAIINSTIQFFRNINQRGLTFDIGYVNAGNARPDNVTEKNIYVVNKHSPNSTFNDTKIMRWIKCKNVCSIPENGSEVNSLIANGYIPLLESKNRQYRDSFKNLVNLIES